MENVKDGWDGAESYELFMGRWSKLITPKFIEWLNSPTLLKWLDVGCGTGTLSEAILKYCRPSHLVCIDPSEKFLLKTKERIKEKADFFNNTVDVIVSGLAFNFFPDPGKALAEMRRVVKPDGIIAAYVWDYSGRMDLLRYFWDEVVLLEPKSRELDEGLRFPICNPDNLKSAYLCAGLMDVQITEHDIITEFKDFDDYWNPFLGGQGPAPGYLASLTNSKKDELRKKLYNKLPIESNGSIRMIARAIAIKGTAVKTNSL
jgi:SAM-dependent methyltransferase